MSRAIAQSDDQFSASEAGRAGVLDLGAAWRSIFIIAGMWLFEAFLILVGIWLLACAGAQLPIPLVLLFPAAVAILGLLCASFIQNAYHFQLVDGRIRASRGVFNRIAVEARLDHIRNITVVRTLPERLLALGTIRMTTAGVGPEVVWRYVAHPNQLAEQIRRLIDAPLAPATPTPPAAVTPAASASSIQPDHVPIDTSMPAAPNPQQSTARLPVIGLAGGIGAGKSTVARAFERLGCHVIDSDTRAKAALERPEIRDTLVQWWGDRVLTPDDRIDRAQVAQVIFSNPAERASLEQLIHPLVREDRTRMIQEATAAGARAVIVDAPLLFEAGIDAECDAVVFVDAPREQRLARIRETRGWDQAELDRREAAQLPLEEKRARSQYIIENRAQPQNLDGQVEEILASIEIGPDSTDLPLPA
jgi:dephospho-CoA kinase